MKQVDPTTYCVVGMSPGNSYFKEEEILYLLKTAVERYGRVGVMVADVPAIATYVAFGYPENRARREKAIPQGNLLKNRARRAMEKLGYTDHEVKIFDWGSEVETNPEYQTSYKKMRSLYETQKTFERDADETTRAVLVGSGRVIPDLEAATKTAVHYLLSEFAFMDWLPKYMGVHNTIYIYHKNWPVFENWIAGKYDGVQKHAIDFLLMENPWETYAPISQLDNTLEQSFENTLDRVEHTKVLRVGFSQYPPAFMHDGAYQNFSGIFYDVLMEIVRVQGWDIVWSEETGYGVIAEGLEHGRFDVFGSPVWPTPEREAIATFSESLYKSPVFPYVRESYRKTHDDIVKDSTVRVVVKENDISHSIARADYGECRMVYVPQLSETMELLRFVAEDRGDVTFVEPYIAESFNETSSVKLVSLTEAPIRIFDNTFIFSKRDMSIKNIFDTHIKDYKASGFIASLVKKHTDQGNDFILE